mmetsp:Transcript_69370/g.104631  ORF Transcript_69370/g.104631 Transcript_69370/m.104631 type:complete len:81 (+) Transcript_69370:583-825(+)
MFSFWNQHVAGITKSVEDGYFFQGLYWIHVILFVFFYCSSFHTLIPKKINKRKNKAEKILPFLNHPCFHVTRFFLHSEAF